MEEFEMDPMMLDMTFHEVERLCERLGAQDEEQEEPAKDAGE